MIRILVLACAIAVSTGAHAQLYKWVDKNGRVSYSDQPPPAEQSKLLKLDPGQPASPQRSAVERDKDLDKARLDAKEKAKVAEEAGRKAKFNEENCVRAKAYLRTVTDGGRIASYDAKGERILLDDQQMEEERITAQKAAEDACKSS